MATEKELEELDQKFDAFRAELDELCAKYNCKIVQDYDDTIIIFNDVNSGNREYGL
jgi:hypothetical protein